MGAGATVDQKVTFDATFCSTTSSDVGVLAINIVDSHTVITVHKQVKWIVSVCIFRLFVEA